MKVFKYNDPIFFQGCKNQLQPKNFNHCHNGIIDVLPTFSFTTSVIISKICTVQVQVVSKVPGQLKT